LYDTVTDVVPFHVTVCETVNATYASGPYVEFAAGSPFGGDVPSVAVIVAPMPVVAGGSVTVPPKPD
jgi:hypothetical protein